MSNHKLKQPSSDKQAGLRLPAGQIEAIVIGEIRDLLSDQLLLANWFYSAGRGDRTEAALARARTALTR